MNVYLALASAVALVTTAVAAFVLLGGFLWGAGYTPVPRKSLERMFLFSEPLAGKRVMDLGSGFGRIVIEVAERHRAVAIGIEMDPIKVWWSSLIIRRKGLRGRARIIRANLMTADLSEADVIYLYLWMGIMNRLQDKVLTEMKPGGLVVSYYHTFSGWKPEVEDEGLRVYAYRVP
jgi:ribosomal protein L11 methylase PrmA